jgi:uncharacterized coiled-coil protein SlyX
MFPTPSASYSSHHGALPNNFEADKQLKKDVAALETRLEDLEQQHAQEMDLVVAENEWLAARVATLEKELGELLAWAKRLTTPAGPGA